MPVDNLQMNILSLSTGMERETCYELITISIIVSSSDGEILKLGPKSLFRYIAESRQEISAHYKPGFVSC